MGKKTKIPTPDERQLLDLARAALSTAAGHHQAAALLLEKASWPQAYALAHLGLEEAGKVELTMILLSLTLVGNAQTTDHDDFARMAGSHQAKAAVAHFVRMLVGDDPGAPTTFDDLVDTARSMATDTNDLKFRGLYSDLNDSGDVLSPSVQVTESDARRIVADLGATLDTMRYQSDGEPSPELLSGELTDRMRELLRGFDFDTLLAQLQADPDAMVAATRQMARNNTAPPEDLLAALPLELRSYYQAMSTAVHETDAGGRPVAP